MDLNLNFDLNKKSLVQIALLVVLVLGGVGAYLYQQGGLDFLSSYFADESPEAKQPPRRKPPTPKPKTPPKPQPAAPAIPVHPAQGQIHGKPFVVDEGTFEQGGLTLRQAKAPKAQVVIHLSLPRWEVPTGKSFKFVNPKGSEAPKIEIQWQEETGAPGAQTFAEQYSLALEFGQARDHKLSGKLRLTLPEQAKSMVAGTFEADIQGFHVINGRPDLSSDSTDTLEFLALREILKEDPNKPVRDIVFRHERFGDPDSAGRPLTGYLEIQYRVEDAAAVIERFQFEKDKKAWRLRNKLKANQLDEAHPRKAPGRKDSPSTLFIYQAAKRLEADVAKKPDAGIHHAAFVTRHNDKHKIGICQISYSRETEGAPVKTTYLFRLKKGGWVLDRELSRKEKVNFTTGKIERR